jgi:hypothetical protein
MRITPDQKWREVLRAVDGKAVPSDPFIKSVYNVMVGTTQDDTIQYAIDKIEEQRDRDSIVAYILSGASHEVIAESLWINSVPVVDVFAKLYMDISVFRDKLEHLRYCEYYLENICPEDDERNQALIRQGISHGPKALELWFKRSGDDVSIAKEDITNAVLQMAFTNAIAAKDVSVTHPIAKESHRWVKTALDAISVRDEHNGLGDDELDAMLTIKKHLSAKSPQDAGITPEDIMH